MTASTKAKEGNKLTCIVAEVRLMRGKGIGNRVERQIEACRPRQVSGFHSKCNGKPLEGF